MTNPPDNANVITDEQLNIGLRIYNEKAWENLRSRWKSINNEIYDEYVSESIGGLLARQCTLNCELANSPNIWNAHTAPIILRSMVDTHITLAWILCDPNTNAKKYVLYGLGQEKLLIEHLEALNSDNPIDIEGLQFKKHWINTQRSDFLTEVNVGSMSGLSTRAMAKLADCEDLYKFAYVPFSGTAHSMWQHVSLYNLKHCDNALHKYHKVPTHTEIGSDPGFFRLAAKYFDLSLEAIDEAYSLDLATKSHTDIFYDIFTKNNDV